MARLYINDPDGRGVYTWDFHSPEWMQRAMWCGNWLVWAGFLQGVETQMRRIKAAERLLAAPDPED